MELLRSFDRVTAAKRKDYRIETKMRNLGKVSSRVKSGGQASVFDLQEEIAFPSFEISWSAGAKRGSLSYVKSRFEFIASLGNQTPLQARHTRSPQIAQALGALAQDGEPDYQNPIHRLSI
jgi:hypothetical protein